MGETTLLRLHRDYFHSKQRLWRIACTAREPMALSCSKQLSTPLVKELKPETECFFCCKGKSHLHGESQQQPKSVVTQDLFRHSVKEGDVLDKLLQSGKFSVCVRKHQASRKDNTHVYLGHGPMDRMAQ